MRKVLMILFLAYYLLSCEKIFMGSEATDDPLNNFEEMWNTLDHRYPFFTYKQIDWDSIYDKYVVNISSGMSQIELYEVLSNMLFELRDGHVNLNTPFDVSRNWRWFLDYPENFDASVLERNYLKEDHHKTGPLLNTIIDSTGYIYYGSFSSNVSPYHIDYVINRFKDLEGIIFDVRNNGGGSTGNIETLVSRFADMRRHTHSTLYKESPAHDDFYPPVPSYIEPKGQRQFLKKVIVLTNRKCYSATNQFVQSMRVFPHVTILGDTTGGGGGTPVSHELPNGWIFRFSSNMNIAPDGFNLEHGIPPDIYEELDEAALLNGEDSIIERALKEMN